MTTWPRIAIPLPLSTNPQYVERSLPQYEQAVRMAGGEPVRIPLDLSPADTMKIVERCDAVLLPGASADVDPAKYGAPRHDKTAPPDGKRDTVDELLLQDAYNMRKPILAICYGLQILNVYRTGTLIQHIESRINHEAGRTVPVAHTVQIDPESLLFRIVDQATNDSIGTMSDQVTRGVHTNSRTTAGLNFNRAANQEERRNSQNQSGVNTVSGLNRNDIARLTGGHDLSRAESVSPKKAAFAAEGNSLGVNSSHHQSADIIGDGLRVVARCPDDGIIEALEGTATGHFVLAVQWHPERSVGEDEPSRAIFRAFVGAAKATHRTLAGEFESIP
jgi:gamma-glutamyl-gamma-aminobutyrate hydrolase PuuD